MTLTQDVLIVGTAVEVRANDSGKQLYWRGGFRVAALTDSGKVYVEQDQEFPGRKLMLLKSEEVRLPK